MSSKGEEKIEKILKAARIKFKREVSFNDLKSFKGKPLRFDFAIFDSNGKIIALLDFDGRQHFEWIHYFHKTKIDFMTAQERDRAKNAYCLARQIPFIRIPYWELDNLTINTILTNPSFRVISKFHNDLLRR